MSLTATFEYTFLYIFRVGTIDDMQWDFCHALVIVAALNRMSLLFIHENKIKNYSIYNFISHCLIIVIMLFCHQIQ